ncbi:MAG: ATPase [Clostridia bacterium]|nr:ATPase [Clostridia bacterium]
MSFKGSEKHFFLGGNTPKGFYSYYDYLLPQESARKIYCIKGGPGTGKSTLMKKVAEAAKKKGADVEFAHCSSDPDSLDGVIIRPANIALVDGTSPHIVDPKTPGAVDTLLNLGSFWDEDALRRHKDGIMKANERIREHFGRAYVYLAAARILHDDAEKICRESIKNNAHSAFEENILYREFAEIPISDAKGNVRKLFASGITPKGMVDYSQTLFEGYKTYTLKGYVGDTLHRICDIAINRGFNVEAYYCPFAPDKRIDHLLIPKLNLAFTVSNKFHSYENGEVVDFTDSSSKYILETHKAEREFALAETDRLINQAISAITQAKQYHDELEKYYIPAMDFGKIDEICEKTVKEVLEFI